MGKLKSNLRTQIFAWILLAVMALTATLLLRKKRLIHYPNFGINIPAGYTVHGIDVSHYQGDIDWSEVKKMTDRGKSIQFCFIKATEGSAMKDQEFNYNWRQAKKNKIIRGAYHYFNPYIDGKAQAQNFVNCVQLQKGDLPPVLDIEEIKNQTPEKLIPEIQVWLRLVENYYGIKPIIYSGANFYNNYLKGKFDDYILWVAHYNVSSPSVNHNWKFWQHSERGNVNGIEPKVDFNVFNGSEAQLNSLCL